MPKAPTRRGVKPHGLAAEVSHGPPGRNVGRKGAFKVFGIFRFGRKAFDFLRRTVAKRQQLLSREKPVKRRSLDFISSGEAEKYFFAAKSFED